MDNRISREGSIDYKEFEAAALRSALQSYMEDFCNESMSKEGDKYWKATMSQYTKFMKGTTDNWEPILVNLNKYLLQKKADKEHYYIDSTKMLDSRVFEPKEFDSFLLGNFDMKGAKKYVYWDHLNSYVSVIEAPDLYTSYIAAHMMMQYNADKYFCWLDGILYFGEFEKGATDGDILAYLSGLKFSEQTKEMLVFTKENIKTYKANEVLKRDFITTRNGNYYLSWNVLRHIKTTKDDLLLKPLSIFNNISEKSKLCEGRRLLSDGTIKERLEKAFNEAGMEMPLLYEFEYEQLIDADEKEFQFIISEIIRSCKVVEALDKKTLNKFENFGKKYFGDCHCKKLHITHPCVDVRENRNRNENVVCYMSRQYDNITMLSYYRHCSEALSLCDKMTLDDFFDHDFGSPALNIIKNVKIFKCEKYYIVPYYNDYNIDIPQNYISGDSMIVKQHVAGDITDVDINNLSDGDCCVSYALKSMKAKDAVNIVTGDPAIYITLDSGDFSTVKRAIETLDYVLTAKTTIDGSTTCVFEKNGVSLKQKLSIDDYCLIEKYSLPSNLPDMTTTTYVVYGLSDNVITAGKFDDIKKFCKENTKKIGRVIEVIDDKVKVYINKTTFERVSLLH